MASSLGMVEADPAPGPSLGPRDDMAGWTGAIFMVMTVVQGSPSAGITMALRRPHKGMKMASSVGTVEADPAPGPSLGPRDDIARWPGVDSYWRRGGDWIPAFAGMTVCGGLL